MALRADVVAVEIQARVQGAQRDVGGYDRAFTSHMANLRRQAGLAENAVGSSMDNMSASVGRMSSTVRRAVSALAIGIAAREVVMYADAWTEAGNKIAAAGTPLEAQQGRLQDLARVAIETRSEFGATATLYARMGIATAELTDHSYDLLRITELVNKAFVAGGASQQERRSGIIQLSQALASGVLQGEELRALRESAPLLMQAIAREYETTIGGLKKLGEEGKLTTERILQAITNGAGDIEGRFSKTNATIGDSFTNLKTRVIEYIGMADDSRGATENLAGAINFVADNVAAFADALMIAAAAAGAVGGASLVKFMAAEVAAVGKTIAAHNARIAVLRAERAVQLESAQATVVAQKARQAEIVTTQGQVAATLELALAQKASALGYVELQQGLVKAGVATGQLEVAQANYAAASRNVIRLQGIQRGLHAELAAAQAAEAAAAGTAAVRQGQYAGIVARTGVASRAAAAGVAVLRGAMSLLGGPVGVAIAAAAAAFYLIDKNARDAAARVERLDQAVSNATRSIASAREYMSGPNAPMKRVGDDAAASARQVFDLTAEIEKLTRGMKNLREEGQVSYLLKMAQDLDALNQSLAESEAAEQRFITSRVNAQKSLAASAGTPLSEADLASAAASARRDFERTKEGQLLLQGRQQRGYLSDQMRQTASGLTPEEFGRQWREGSGKADSEKNTKAIEAEGKVLKGLLEDLKLAKEQCAEASVSRLQSEIAEAQEVMRLLRAGVEEELARDFAKDKTKADKKAEKGADKTEKDDLRTIKSVTDAWDKAFLTKREQAEASYQAELLEIGKLSVAQKQKDELAAKALAVRDKAIADLAEDEIAAINSVLDARDQALGNEIAVINRRADAEKKAAQKQYEPKVADKMVAAIEERRVAEVKAYNDKEAADKKRLLDDVLAMRLNALGDYEALAEMEFAVIRDKINAELTAETGKYEALQALEIAHGEFLKDARERMKEDRLREALEEADTVGEGFRAQWDIMKAEAEKSAGDIGILFAETFGPGGTIQESIGEAAGRAIAFGDDFTDAMENAARAIASDLISALVQYGIQLVAQAALGKALGAAAVASTVAQAAASASAWAPAAGLASLATLGANAAPAAAALASTVALSKALAVVPGFKDGVVDFKGKGTGRSDSNVVRISDGESVINAPATAKNKRMLRLMNSGVDVEGQLSRIQQPMNIRQSILAGRASNVSVAGSNLYFNGPVDDGAIPALRTLIEQRDRELEGRIRDEIARDRIRTTPRHERDRFFED